MIKKAICRQTAKKCILYLICTLSAATFSLLAEKNPCSSKINQTNLAFGTACLTSVGIGLKIPLLTIYQAARARTYFLGALSAQTIVGTAKNLHSKKETMSPAKLAADITYGLYNAAFIEIARRMPIKTIKQAGMFRTYSAFCIVSQAAGVLLKDSLANYLPSIKKLASRPSSPLLISSERALKNIDLY